MRENDFLNWIATHTPAGARVQLGIGDDMAAVRVPTGLALLKIDQALDRVHFDLNIHTPGQAGIKAVNRCLSDCAAMACVPAAILLAVALPKSADEAFAQAIFQGCSSAAGAFSCPIVGGDTAIWDQRLAITIAAMGTSDRAPVTRSGAKPGDAICVTGALGGSILGRHMTFTPRLNEAQRLISAASIHAMMDLSDGLAADLPRLCKQSGVGAIIEAISVPVHKDAAAIAEKDNTSAVAHAMCDGEDYELLFTLAPADVVKVQAACPGLVTRIGQITANVSIYLQDESGRQKTWPKGGWEYKS
jgi:thiamine-monophosphate kinase